MNTNEALLKYAELHTQLQELDVLSVPLSMEVAQALIDHGGTETEIYTLLSINERQRQDIESLRTLNGAMARGISRAYYLLHDGVNTPTVCGYLVDFLSVDKRETLSDLVFGLEDDLKKAQAEIASLKQEAKMNKRFVDKAVEIINQKPPVKP